MPKSLASLKLNYSFEEGSTVLRHEHSGPLRVLKSLYPEGKHICHNILIHPPSGLVGGDVLDIQIQLGAGAHALITTPGAARFFASQTLPAKQQTVAQLGAQSRLEWLPMESLAYDACLGLNETIFELAPESLLMAWDLVSLGLPHANLPFRQGRFFQHLEIKGLWLDKGVMDASDQRLLTSPLGLQGKTCLASMVLASGSKFERPQKDQAVELARQACEEAPPSLKIGVSSPHERLVVVRALSDQVEPCMRVFQKIRAAWRQELWGQQSSAPRIWNT